MKRLIYVLIILPLVVAAQNKEITLEDIFKKGTFRGEFVRGFTGEDINKFVDAEDVLDENGKKISLGDYTLTNDKTKILVRTDREAIYRHSSKSYVYLHDITGKKTHKLDPDKIMHATFSPDGTKIAYVKNNNLYLYDIATGTKTAITTDGKWNFIINGNCDWVYEEEFSFTRAYEWSEKGNYIAYYRFDESKVKEYEFTIFDTTYNKQYSYKYPKAGEDNSTVEIHIYDLASKKDIKAQFDEGDIYIPRIKWTKNDNQLVVYWMNRHQNNLKLLLTEATTGFSSTLYEEKNKYYIDINDDWLFLKDGKNFMFTSEMDGYRHIYLYSMDGKSKVQITRGPYEVTNVNAVDEANKRIFYTMAWPRPMDRNIFVTDFTGNKTYPLTNGEGWHRIELNDDMTRFYDFSSDLNNPQQVALYDIVISKKKKISTRQTEIVGENQKLVNTIKEYGFGKAEFIRIPNSKGDTLNGWMLKSVHFDTNKKYPVLFCNYGGPGSQQVANRFGAVSAWHQFLAQNGFIVVSVDNTGTGFRGEEFKKKTYLQLGKFEIEDQIDAAKYLATMPFVDKNKIGHWGWSYGGFMSSLAITKGNDVFSAAVAVAPVTSWRYYDNIYTERFMRTPQENPDGYDKNSPINFTDRIKGKFLLIHGTADDNVHFQNSTQMVTALVKSNIDFESAYYPNKNHGIGGMEDNTTFHLWSKMTNWIFKNLGNDNSVQPGSLMKKKSF